MVNETRGGWLANYQRELGSGKWGRILSIWFDEPLDSDIPWEPCAITQFYADSGPVYILLVEDFLAQPRRLKEWARYKVREAAYAGAARVHPWNLRASAGYNPAASEWDAWLEQYGEYWELRHPDLVLRGSAHTPCDRDGKLQAPRWPGRPAAVWPDWDSGTGLD
jgi:hypothetical protein